MSSIFSLRRSNEEDDRTADGKIVRGRRSRASERTPYAHPIPLQSQPEEAESSGNPNWISGLINPARAIASGAEKIFSSVFGPDYSSSSSSGGDSSSEDEDDASDAADVDRNKTTHGEIGSPVDMAKSFMQAQPTWSSSALKRVEFNTPSPMKNAKEIFHSPVQLSEMEGSAHSTGSWNLLDEIRRVRSKATEELLATTPSKKISFPSDSPADKSMLDTTTKNVSNERIGDELSSDPNTSLAENGSKLPESVEMDCEKSEGGALQSNKRLKNMSPLKTKTSFPDASVRSSSSREPVGSSEFSVSNASGVETEWVEQDEPGVYITIRV